MPLTLNSFADLYAAYEATVANNSPINNFRTGSVARALGLALVGNGISIEKVLADLANQTRLATSNDAATDSFVADFGLTRLQPTYATGTLVLQRSSAGSVQGILPGAIVQSSDGTVQFTVVADPSQTSWNPVQNWYAFGTSDIQINVTVQCNVAGTIGNVNQNMLTQPVSGFIGISGMYNPLGFTTGRDQEATPALKLRFVQYLASLSKASNAAIATAILGVQPNVTYQIIEYKHFDGSAFVAGFTVVVDDGTGAATSAFTTAVYTAVDAVRAAGIQFEVRTPTNVPVSVACTVTPNVGISATVAQANAVAAFVKYIKGLGVGVIASFAGIENAIATASGVFAVTNFTVNGGTTDVAIAATQIAQPGTVSFV